MNIEIPVQMTVSEGFGPIPAPASSLLVANTTPQGSDVVLDKTFREILNAPCCIINFASDDGTFNGKWLVCEIHTAPQLTIVASAWFDGSLSPVTFQASSYDGYPISV